MRSGLVLSSTLLVALVACGQGNEVLARGDADAGSDAAAPQPPAPTPDASLPPAVCADAGAVDPALLCAPGAERDVPCGQCGKQHQRCTDTCTFQPSGSCHGEGACAAGDTERTSASCTGSFVKVRACSATCAWGGWSACGASGWRTMAVSPRTSLNGAFSAGAWTGTELVFWGTPTGTAYDQQAMAYTVATDTWRLFPNPAPVAARWGPAAHWVGGRALFFGGDDPSGARTNDGVALDPATGNWSTIPPSPLAPRAGPTTVALKSGHELFVVGGFTTPNDVVTFMADGAIFDTTTQKWRPTAPAPRPLASISAVSAFAMGSKVVVSGANAVCTTGTCPPPGVLVYDVVADTWASIPFPPGQDDAPAVPIDGDRVAFWGGSATQQQKPGFVEDPRTGSILTLSTGTWTPMAPAPATVVSGRYKHFLFSDGASIWAWGGLLSSLPVTSGARYEIATKTWTAMPLSPRGLATGVAFTWTGAEALFFTGRTANGIDGEIFRP